MLAVRNRSDVAPMVRPVEALLVERTTDADALAALQNRSEDELRRRLDDGHRAYVARVAGRAAAFGWVATRTAEIGELRAAFRIAGGERYLWNFVTLPAHRGQGIYPALIEAIVSAESGEAERFWIAYAPENHASAAGIRKAGFRTVAALSFDANGRPAVRALVEGGGRMAARCLGIPEAHTELAQCWKCVRAGRTNHYCPPESCRCDYQQPTLSCHP